MNLNTIKKINKEIRKLIEEIEPRLIYENKICAKLGDMTDTCADCRAEYDEQSDKIYEMLDACDLLVEIADAEEVIENYNDYSIEDIEECKFFLKHAKELQK